MGRSIVLLRGVNLVRRNRVSMPALRSALEEAGFEDVRTYVQSGNVVLSTTRSAARVRRDVEQVLTERFGLDVDVVVRSRSALAAIVARDPLGDLASDPKLCQVTFLEKAPPTGLRRALEDAATSDERVVVRGREIYSWHPRGRSRSKLAALLAGRELGVTATARNWRTVEKLLTLTEE